LGNFYVSDSVISERTIFLKNIARNLLEAGVLAAADGIILREPRISLLTKGYFLLNLAYKNWRMPDGHFTEKPKIAALLCVSIREFEPFIPPQPDNVMDLQQCRCNEIYAFTCAMAILEKKFDPRTEQEKDFWLRILDIIHDTSAETLDPYVSDINNRQEKSLDQYRLEIHPKDMLGINSLISIFELISNKITVL
jgi:hypothetical protein